MKPRFVTPALLAILLGACTDQPNSSTTAAPPLSAPIETLWVADQITGFLGKWVRSQQRYLISDSKVSFQDFYLEMGGGIAAEVYSAEYPVVSHRKNEYGGVIEYRQAPGELLTITQEMDEEDQFQAPQRSAERFDIEEGVPNSILAYRWIDGGRVDLLDLYPEEESEGTSKAIDVDEVLASLSDPAAFAALRWIDEESLLPGAPPFVNLAELRKFGETLADFPRDDEVAFAEVSTSLDQSWKAAANDPSPKHLGGIGMFTGAHRFALVFPEAMREAGYHPILSAFSFARARDRSHFEGDLSEDEQRTVDRLQTRYEPYADLFEGSLRRLVEAPDSVASLPPFVSAQDRQQSGELANAEAKNRFHTPVDTEEESPIPPPPPHGKPDYGSNESLEVATPQERVPESTVVTIRNEHGYLAAISTGAEGTAIKAGIQSEPFPWQLEYEAVPFLSDPENTDSPPIPQAFTLRPSEEGSLDFLLAETVDQSVSVAPNLSAVDRSHWATGRNWLVFGRKVRITSLTNLVRGFHLVDREGDLVLQEGREDSAQWIFEEISP